MNYLQLGIGAIALSLAFYGGMRLEQSSQMKLELVASKAATESSILAAKAIKEIEVKQTVINTKVREIIKTEYVYSECKHTPDAYLNILRKFE